MVLEEYRGLRRRIAAKPDLSQRIVAAAIKSQPGATYIGTHHVHHFYFPTKDVVFKEARRVAPAQNFFYAAQDFGFLHSRRFFASGKDLLEKEAEKLLALEDDGPQLAPYLLQWCSDIPAILKTYIPGKTFREMDKSQRRTAIPGIVQLVQNIHGKGVAIGDAHIKNAIYRFEDETMLWLGFSGVIDETDPVRAKANDLLKLAYSTFTETKDLHLSLLMAEALADYDGYKEKQKAAEILKSKGWSPQLWWATRIGPGGHKELKSELLRSFHTNRVRFPGRK